jgi:hypothetical protein
VDNEIGKTFLLQARLHLNDDFMPKIEKCLDVLSEELAHRWGRGVMWGRNFGFEFGLAYGRDDQFWFSRPL